MPKKLDFYFLKAFVDELNLRIKPPITQDFEREETRPQRTFIESGSGGAEGLRTPEE